MRGISHVKGLVGRGHQESAIRLILDDGRSGRRDEMGIARPGIGDPGKLYGRSAAIATGPEVENAFGAGSCTCRLEGLGQRKDNALKHSICNDAWIGPDSRWDAAIRTDDSRIETIGATCAGRGLCLKGARAVPALLLRM
jgi:hypothetical protein